MTKYAEVAALLALALSACGGGGGGGDDTSGEPDAMVVPDAEPELTAAGAITLSIQLGCEKLHECRGSYPGTQEQFEDSFGATVEECIVLLGQQVDPQAYQDAVDAGRILFDPQDARICLDGYDAITCPDLWSGAAEFPPECDTTFTGTVADGQPCTLQEECVSGNCDVGGTDTCQP